MTLENYKEELLFIIQNQFKLTCPLGSKDNNESQNFEWSLTSTVICKDEARALNPPWRGFTGGAKVCTSSSLQFLSCVLLFATPYNPMDHSNPGFPVHHKLLEITQTHAHQWCHPTTSSSVIHFSSHLQSFPASGNFQWVHSSHQVARGLEFEL